MTQLISLFAGTFNTCSSSGSFFGLVPWWQYLPAGDFNGCNIQNFNLLPSQGAPSDIPYVLLAVVDDLLRIAGIIAVGFVFYGAVLYITSQGNSDQTAKAQHTLINALVGLAIAIVAIVFVSFLGSKLG